MEEELGVQLFQRDRHKVRLTGAGQCFLEKARLVLKSLALAVDETREVGRVKQGRIRVGYVDMAFYSGALPDKIRHFQEQNPGLQVELIPGTSAEQTGLLESGDLDVGLIYQEPVACARLDSCQLSTEPLAVAVHQDNLLARRASVSLSDLGDEPFVWFDRVQNPVLFDYVDDVCRRHGLRRRIILDGANDPSQLALIAARVGVTFSPVSAVHMKPANVRLIVLQGRPLHVSLYAAWRKDAAASSLARNLLGALCESQS